MSSVLSTLAQCHLLPINLASHSSRLSELKTEPGSTSESTTLREFKPSTVSPRHRAPANPLPMKENGATNIENIYFEYYIYIYNNYNIYIIIYICVLHWKCQIIAVSLIGVPEFHSLTLTPLSQRKAFLQHPDSPLTKGVRSGKPTQTLFVRTPTHRTVGTRRVSW